MNSSFKKCSAWLIQFLGGINISFEDESLNEKKPEHHPSVTYDTLLAEGNRIDSVHVIIVAYNSSKTINVTESHRFQLEDKETYSYTVDTNGIIVFAYTMSHGDNKTKYDLIDLKMNKSSSSLNAKYIVRAKTLICGFYSSQMHMIEENNKPRADGVSIGGRTSGEVTKEEFLNQGSLLLTDDLKKDFHIVSFRMALINEKTHYFKFFKNDDGAELTEEMREAIKNVVKGFKISLPGTRCLNKDGSSLELPNQNFEFK